MTMRRRRKDQDSADDQADTAAAAGPAGPRAHGPWDSSERSPDTDDPNYLDLGSLWVLGNPGFTLQVPTDDDAGTMGSVVLVTEESGLELRAFADARSGGLWDDVRADLELEAMRLDGECEEVDGPFGPELRVRIPVELPDGEPGFQPSRIVGIEGPRWMLRATFLGREALEPDDDSVLMHALRDVIVVRGDEPMAPREALLITFGEGLDVVESSPR
jgi:hypothetical protein